MQSMLVIGRFQPFHLGHLEVIKRYAAQGYFVKIVVGSIKCKKGLRDPFSMEERDDMIRLALDELSIKRFALYYLPDETDDMVWVDLLLTMVGRVDVLFSGNPWVTSLLENKGFEVHSYDESKNRFGDISATAIRDEWLEKGSSRGLPESVFHYLKGISAHERLKELKEKEKK